MKKILSCFLVCAFLCTGLYGCGSKKTELIEEAKDLTLSQEISITPEQNDYGIPAYQPFKRTDKINTAISVSFSVPATRPG